MFEGLKPYHYRAILIDPPWRFETYDKRKHVGRGKQHYRTASREWIATLPLHKLAADDCALFTWVSWPQLDDALHAIAMWGFTYKSCAFCWMKSNANGRPAIGTGYWTRANSEVCLLATRGRPQRLSRAIPQAILEPRREHSRKPDCVRERIERLVAGPYVELFARSRRPGWDAWGDEVNRFEDVSLTHAMYRDGGSGRAWPEEAA